MRCLLCKSWGHKARHCKQPQKPSVPHPAPLLPTPDIHNFPHLVSPKMAQLGDPAERPEDTSTTAFTNSDMEDELVRLSSHAAVAWIGRNRPRVEPGVVKKAICSKLGVLPEDVTVVKHHPEDFYIDFTHRHHRDEAVNREMLPHGNLEIHIRPWRLLTHGDFCSLQYHVKLCLEGIPLHAWNENIAKRAIARACDLDYVKETSLDKKDTRALSLWAWTCNPSAIPKVTWLTLSESRVLWRGCAATCSRTPRPHFQGACASGPGGGPTGE